MKKTEKKLMIKTAIYFTEYQLKILKKMKKKTDINVSELIRNAVDEYLEKRQKK